MAPKYKPDDKKYAMRKHAINKLKYRYRIWDADEELYHKLCKYIKQSQGKNKTYDDGTKVEFIDKQSNTRSAWRIYWNNKTLICAYDKTRKLIATFLPSGLGDDEIQYKKWMYDDEC